MSKKSKEKTELIPVGEPGWRVWRIVYEEIEQQEFGTELALEQFPLVGWERITSRTHDWYRAIYMDNSDDDEPFMTIVFNDHYQFIVRGPGQPDADSSDFWAVFDNERVGPGDNASGERITVETAQEARSAMEAELSEIIRTVEGETQ